MNTRRLLGRGTCAACVSLFLLNDFLCTHLRLDSPPPGAQSCPSGIHITRVDTRAGESRIGRTNGGDDVRLEVDSVAIQFGQQSSTLVVGVSGTTAQPKTVHHFTNAHESAAAPGVGTFSLEYVRPVGVVFGPKDPWAVFCFNRPTCGAAGTTRPTTTRAPPRAPLPRQPPGTAHHPPPPSPTPRPNPPQCRTHPRPALPRTPEQRPPEGAEEPWTFAAPVRKGS